MRSKAKNVASFLVLVSLFVSITVSADTRFYKPYVLAYQADTALAATIDKVRADLQNGGFTVAGEFSPYADAHVLAVTNDRLRALAARSEYGGYGAVLRVAVTMSGNSVQVSYTNPLYMAIIYRMGDSLEDVSHAMANTIGNEQEFGSETGLTEFTLSKYHYMMFMPYFTDQLELASYDSYSEALDAVEQGLAAGKGGTRKVYRVDVPGKDESVFGVAIEQGEGSDKAVMATTDIADLKHTAHLPYELLVSDGEVYALHGKFRIAQSFPDLTMGTFMRISDAPDAIEDALKAAASGAK